MREDIAETFVELTNRWASVELKMPIRTRSAIKNIGIDTIIDLPDTKKTYAKRSRGKDRICPSCGKFIARGDMAVTLSWPYPGPPDTYHVLHPECFDTQIHFIHRSGQ